MSERGAELILGHSAGGKLDFLLGKSADNTKAKNLRSDMDLHNPICHQALRPKFFSLRMGKKTVPSMPHSVSLSRGGGGLNMYIFCAGDSVDIVILYLCFFYYLIRIFTTHIP